MANWNSVRKKFKIDGSLRDLYVCGTELHDWQIFLDFLRISKMTFIFTIDGIPRDLPRNINDVIILRNNSPLSLQIVIDGNITLNCHFFLTNDDTDPIELDVDPKEIQSEESFNSLWSFISKVGIKLKKKVHLTHENSPQSIIATFIP
jgi:hypothetical protein